MRRCLTILIAAVLALGIVLTALTLLLSYLFAPQDSILNSLPDYESKEFYSSGSFQDYTDYGKYTYRVYETEFIKNPYFLRVSDEDVPKILSYIENFEDWVEICEDFPAEHYDFDKALLNLGDYYYILNKYEEPGKEFDNYNLYYYDLETQVLYYFHNNI